MESSTPRAAAWAGFLACAAEGEVSAAEINIKAKELRPIRKMAQEDSCSPVLLPAFR